MMRAIPKLAIVLLVIWTFSQVFLGVQSQQCQDLSSWCEFKHKKFNPHLCSRLNSWTMTMCKKYCNSCDVDPKDKAAVEAYYLKYDMEHPEIRQYYRKFQHYKQYWNLPG